MQQFNFSAIAIIESCYKQKFGIPRQPGLVPSGKGVIRFLPEFAMPEAVEGLEQASHIWVNFVFHGIETGAEMGSWSPKVRPPRLGGNRKIGVFASRSGYRPNSLGQSVVRLDGIDLSDGVSLHVSGIDFLHGTPVLDIKPYLPYADRVPGATNNIASSPPDALKVHFSDDAQCQLKACQISADVDLNAFIVEVLQQDPRPAYKHLDGRVYGVKLLNFELKWHYKQSVDSTEIEVLSLEILP